MHPFPITIRTPSSSATLHTSAVLRVDTSGLRPWARRPHHSVSKAGLIMLTEVTAAVLAQYQIRANALVLPSTGQSEENWRKSEARLPLKRSGDPDDVARAAVFLATNDTITGAVLRVDSGEWLGA
ncbi:MAG: SDR family oxidoreductase [Chloroflexota bacterium]